MLDVDQNTVKLWEEEHRSGLQLDDLQGATLFLFWDSAGFDTCNSRSLLATGGLP